MPRLIECVPNFSEGRDPAVIRRITDAIETVDGVTLLDVDPGKATNRTVVTFAGEPEAVIEAAVRAGRTAKETIDMSRHSGEHPRFGAMDVCPLIPIAGVTMEETVGYARELGRRLGEELGLTIYLYENAASIPERKNLADVRAGEYEGLPERLANAAGKPDFGPAAFQPKSGATAVGAREFLVAYNINLNTKSVARANSVAFAVREKGRRVRNEQGKLVRVPGALKGVKGIGWFIEEYGIAQVSMNLTNIQVTPVHVAFDESCRQATEHGLRVTGSELVGLVPLSAMLDAGRYFLAKQRRSTGVSDAELVHIAVRSMGLDELSPFDPKEKIIEYRLADPKRSRLAELTVRGFVEETASESMAPGGGSVSAALGALGAALGTMVANLSAAKKGWDERIEEFSGLAERGKALHAELVRLVDADTQAFDGIVAARRSPKGTDEEKAARQAAIQRAVRAAIEVPLRTMECSVASLEVIEQAAREGNPASISDAGVGALCARSAALGAELNVRINVGDLSDADERGRYLARAEELGRAAQAAEQTVLGLVGASFEGA
jgi:glutamate formiminotransferase/formiminotetrahydrofolate cyclodeaminase